MRDQMLRSNRNPQVTDGPTAEDMAVAFAMRDHILAREGERVVKIGFFGSRAKGCPAEDSDLDLLVIMQGVSDEDRVEEGDRVTIEMHSSFPIQVDVKVYSPEFYEAVKHEPGLVGYEVERTGIVIYSVA